MRPAGRGATRGFSGVRAGGTVGPDRAFPPAMSSPIVLALPAGARFATFAEGCRAAVLDFVNRVSLRPDKAMLAEWLRGPYRAHVAAIAPTRTRRIETSPLVPGALEKLLVRVRGEVVEALRLSRDPSEGVAFGYSALAAGLVYRARDAAGADGWVPVAQPRMRLVDRVLSLVAADYLLRSDDYENALFECARCDSVAFDRGLIEGGVCDGHAHAPAPQQSDIRELLAALAPRLAVAS
jgi:hypothetical protein